VVMDVAFSDGSGRLCAIAGRQLTAKLRGGPTFFLNAEIVLISFLLD
jgi:hypothetical protein